ncbi:MAG: hypothetical protein RL026_1778 [Pseudomonadota bacterium]|jgi:nitrilase
MRLAVLQMTSGCEVAPNLVRAGGLLAAAADAGADLAVLPENFAFMGRDSQDRSSVVEAPGAGPIQEFLAAAAQRHRLTIVGGTLPLRTQGEERAGQALLVYGPDGRCLARYDKIHLFDVVLPDGESYRESKHLAPGREVVVADTPAGRIGLSICYDLRFPELFRRLAAREAQLMVVPAAFTAPTGEAHWEVLLRARAIENQCVVAAAGQWGRHENGRETWGHSLVVDSWGRVLAERAEGEGIAVADIDFDAQQALRSRFPALAHRVLDRA